MTRQQILTALDDEIEMLTYVRALVADIGYERIHSVPKRRTMSAEGRKHIVDAQRRRWAKAKKNQQP